MIKEVMDYNTAGITTGRLSSQKMNLASTPGSSGMKMKSARNMYRYARRGGETSKSFREWARATLADCRTGSAKLLSVIHG